jgi:hypothetical protein
MVLAMELHRVYVSIVGLYCENEIKIYLHVLVVGLVSGEITSGEAGSSMEWNLRDFIEGEGGTSVSNEPSMGVGGGPFEK